jgi:hypothetical protein
MAMKQQNKNNNTLTRAQNKNAKHAAGTLLRKNPHHIRRRAAPRPPSQGPAAAHTPLARLVPRLPYHIKAMSLVPTRPILSVIS